MQQAPLRTAGATTAVVNAASATTAGATTAVVTAARATTAGATTAVVNAARDTAAAATAAGIVASGTAASTPDDHTATSTIDTTGTASEAGSFHSASPIKCVDIHHG